MFDLFDCLAVGDRIAWWEDPGGRGAEPGTAGAEQLTGVVTHMFRNPAGAVVACFVDITTDIGGAWNGTIRPDLGHQPRRVPAPPRRPPTPERM